MSDSIDQSKDDTTNGTKTERVHLCASCKKPLRRIIGKMGPFWGCTGFPQCKVSFNDFEGRPSEQVDEHYRCPLCTRRLVRSDKGSADYWYCSGFAKGCKTHLKDIDGVPETGYPCRECGNVLIERSGKNGEFWGCKGYPACTASYPDQDGRPQF